MSGQTGQSSQYASPQIAVEVWPWEGGPIALTAGQVLEANISLRTVGSQASIVLAPGGPQGQGFPSWAQVLTLQSLVVIALARAGRSQVVFVGVLQAVEEEQSWETGSRVLRNTRLQAMDWTAWFQDFNWSPLSFLGAVNGQALASALGLPSADQGIPDVLFGGDMSTNPGRIANDWFTKIMGGTEGILAQTRFQYQGRTVLWPAATAAWFEVYPYSTIFPASSYFVSQAGSWEAKFQEILEPPFYETLIGTAPSGIWAPAVGTKASNQQPEIVVGPGIGAAQGIKTEGFLQTGLAFKSLGLPGAVPALPQIVGRVQPMPDLDVAVGTQASSGLSGQPAVVLSPANLSRWQALPAFSEDPGEGFISSRVSLNLGSYYNFFALNPTMIRTPLQGTGGSNTPGIFLYVYSGAANIAGIRRYGFRSMVRDTRWWADQTGQVAEALGALSQADQSALGGPQGTLAAALTTRLASFWTPVPLMESAEVEMPLRPDVFPGCRWTYSPFRGDEPWQFYIQGVTHRWVFGGPSITELTLSRGLPQSTYQDLSLMRAVLTGNAQRVGGSIVSGLPAGSGPGLQVFGYAADSLKTVLGEIAGVYVTPGAH